MVVDLIVGAIAVLTLLIVYLVWSEARQTKKKKEQEDRAREDYKDITRRHNQVIKEEK